MDKFFTPTFLKFFTRFIVILLIGVIGVLVAGNIHSEKKEASTYQPRAQFQTP
ncbi:MAG: hypothetical protein Q8R36_02955 [bacterium]|nr:hypothetical protein [bacterium]